MFSLLASAFKTFRVRVKTLSHTLVQEPSTGNVGSHEKFLLSIQTHYMQMLLHLDKISKLHTLLADLFMWVLLAEYLVFFDTFTTLCNLKTIKNVINTDKLAKMLVNIMQNVLLLWLIVICCIIGASKMLWLWWRWQENYIWLSGQIFL